MEEREGRFLDAAGWLLVNAARKLQMGKVTQK